MIHLGKESKLSPTKVLERAIEFFGPDGIGLEVKEQDEGCARFEGGGGYVFVQVCEKEKGTEVDLESREWEYQVKQFMGKI
jgi:hypothetical protein